MLAIHPVHRRLAQIVLKASSAGGFDKLSEYEQVELNHCLQVNAKLVCDMDMLKHLSFLAYEMNDTEWQQDLCRRKSTSLKQGAFYSYWDRTSRKLPIKE